MEDLQVVEGYLEDEGYTLTCRTFMKECTHLQEYVTLLKRGRQYPLTINGFTLIQILDKFAQVFMSGKQSLGVSSLWTQFDSLTACLKKQTSCKNFRVDGRSQNSRTRRAQVKARLEIEETGDSERVNVFDHQQLSSNVIDSSCKTHIAESSQSLEERLTFPVTPTTTAAHNRLNSTPSYTLISPCPVTNNSIQQSMSQLILINSSGKVASPNNSGTITPNKSSSTATRETNADNNILNLVTVNNENTQVLREIIHTSDDDNEGFCGDGVDSSMPSSPIVPNTSKVTESLLPHTSQTETCDFENQNKSIIISKVVNSGENVVDNLLPGLNHSVMNQSQPVLDVSNILDKVSSTQNVTKKSEVTQCKISEQNEQLHTTTEMEIDGQLDMPQIGIDEPKTEKQNGPGQIIPQLKMNKKLVKTPQKISQASIENKVECSNPVTPEKAVPLCPSKTPVKSLREYGLKGQGKSPRRKRPPKRKSKGEKSTERRSSLPHLNDSSNSHDGSLNDNSFPTQFIEQLLNNPLLHERLAENINKTINGSDLSKSQNGSDLSLVQDTSQKSGAGTPKPSTSLEDILDPHETQMTTDQINDIIEMTKQESVFDSLINLFSQDSAKVNTTTSSHCDKVQSDDLTDSTLNQPSSVIESGFKHVTDHPVKTFENKYVTEESINAVLNIYPTQTRTLNTPTDFSVLESFVTLTSTSSNTAPTVTMSTASLCTLPLCTTVTTDSQSGSRLSYTVSTVDRLQHEKSSSNQTDSKSLQQDASLTGAARENKNMESLASEQSFTIEFSNTPHKQLKNIKCNQSSNVETSSVPPDIQPVQTADTPEKRPVQIIHPPTEIQTPHNLFKPVTASSGHALNKSTPYTTFVQGVVSAENSSTPVGQRNSPLTVQFEDSSNTFKDLPADVKQLYSSFEENLCEESRNKVKERKESRSTRNLRSKKSADMNEKDSKDKRNKDAPYEKISLKGSNKIEISTSSVKIAPKESSVSSKSPSLISPASSTSSKKSGSSVESTTRNKKKSQTSSKHSTPTARQKDKRPSPKPQIRCEALQPKGDNKKTNHSPKWSTGLSALIKIASPEKEKENASVITCTTFDEVLRDAPPEMTAETPTGRKKGSKVKSSVTPTSRQNKPKTPKSRKSGNSEKEVSTKKKSSNKVVTFSKAIVQNESSGASLNITNNITGGQTSILSPSNYSHSKSTNLKPQPLLPVKGPTQTKTSPNLITMGPSCLGIVVKVDTKHGTPARELVIPTVRSSASSQISIASAAQHDRSVTESPNSCILKQAVESADILSGPKAESDVVVEPLKEQENHLSMPILSLGTSENFLLNPPLKSTDDRNHEENLHNSSIQTIVHCAEVHKDQNGLASLPLVSEQNNPRKFNFNELIYSESQDFLDSPTKHHRMSDIQSGGSICNEQPTNFIYTATPLPDENTHVKTLDFDHDSSSLPGSGQEHKEKSQNKKPTKSSLGRTKKASRKNTKSAKSKARNSGELVNNKSTLNSNSSLSNELKSLTEAGSVGISSVAGSTTFTINRLGKDRSIYRPLSETESDDNSNSRFSEISNRSSASNQSKMPWETEDDFIPDAAGNVHLNNGQIKRILSNESINMIGLPPSVQLASACQAVVSSQNTGQQQGIEPTFNENGQDVTSHPVGTSKAKTSVNRMDDHPSISQGAVFLMGQNIRQLQDGMSTSVKTTIHNLQQMNSNERFIMSPSCQKLISGLDINIQTDKLLGQPVNTHVMISPRKNRLLVPKPPTTGITNVVDLHLFRENSSDTNSSELEKIYSTAKVRNAAIKEHKKTIDNKGFKAVDGDCHSHHSTDSEDIDVEGDWENPWKNVSQDATLLQNSINSTLNATAIEKTLTESKQTSKSNEASSDNKSIPTSCSNNKVDPVKPVSNNSKEVQHLHKPATSELTSHQRFLMSPPKKRITASMKCGSGLYFVSTKATTEKDRQTKKTPKKTPNRHMEVRRSPRVKQSPHSKKKEEEKIDKVKRNLDLTGEKSHNEKAGRKRPREDNAEQSSPPKAKVKRVKTPVDLSSLNVDKFLSKLYKN